MTQQLTWTTLLGIAISGFSCFAEQPDPNPNPGNPIVETLRAADPDVHVWEGRVWMYTSQDHDPPEGAPGYSKMDGYHVFSSSDLRKWTDHGEVLHSRDVDWGVAEGGWMWAPGAARKNGTYFLYFPHHDSQGQFRIGVSTSDRPEGPFRDSGKPLAGTSGIDPMVFIDDDGQAYLYFGNAKVARLSDDMLTLAEEPKQIEYGATNFKEGAWVFKRDGKYYYSWTDWTDKTNQGYYAIGDSPYGPFNYKGPVGPRPDGAQDHHSIVEFQGDWYYFYHVGNFTNSAGEPGRGNRRNACVERLTFNQDGTIELVKHTAAGVDPTGSDRKVAEQHGTP
jgi:hypothetical protein